MTDEGPLSDQERRDIAAMIWACRANLRKYRSHLAAAREAPAKANLRALIALETDKLRKLT